MKTLLLVLLIVVGCAAPEPPRYVSIDSDIPEAARAVITEAVVGGWCDASGGQWCPEIALWAGRGRISLAEVIEMDAENLRSCPAGHSCFVAGHNDGDNIQISRETIEGASVNLWRTTMHELGHYCTRHTKHGLMNPTHGWGEPDSESWSVDEMSLKAWRDGCAFE